MSCKRKSVYFGVAETKMNESVGNIPRQLFRQEEDWTCSLACLRTMISGTGAEVLPELEYVKKYNMQPGPYYSKDIKACDMLCDFDVVYGCDTPKITLDDIIKMLDGGYYIMLESMVNYSHWMVLMAYLTVDTGDGLEGYKLLFFEPYYNEVRLINADEFIGVWRDGSYETSRVERDFIALKLKQ